MTGPCCHCGTEATPCWRKGPAEKPVLCNACGARYLVKRSLDGYHPGARKGGVTANPEKPKAPRQRPAVAGTKRKAAAESNDSFEVQARRMYEEYRVLQELTCAALLYRQAQLFVGSDGPSKETHSESTSGSGSLANAADEAHDDSCKNASKDGHFLDASSDDYLEHQQDRMPEAAGQATSAGHVDAYHASFRPRPRKQSRPLACS